MSWHLAAVNNFFYFYIKVCFIVFIEKQHPMFPVSLRTMRQNNNYACKIFGG